MNTKIEDCLDYENLSELDKYILAKLSELNDKRSDAIKKSFLP